MGRKIKKYNVRKAIFTVSTDDNKSVEVEVVGRLHKKSFLFFWTKWIPELVDPESIIEKWGKIGFIKISPRVFISTNKVNSISFKTGNFIIEK